MPELANLGAATLAAAVTSSLVIAAALRAPGSFWRSAGAVPGLGLGIFAGIVVLGQAPRFSPVEDRERFLIVLLPLAMMIEILIASQLSGARSRRLTWTARAAVAIAATPILLYRTTYLADLSGPGSAEWSTTQAIGISIGLGALLLAVWGALDRLATKTSESSLAAVLSMTAITAGFTVMMSGYFKAGYLALPLAGALAGAAIVGAVGVGGSKTSTPEALRGGVAIGVIGIFAVLVIGRFFGSLPTSAALALGAAPLAAWLTEIPIARRLSPRTRSALQLALVVIPLLVVVAEARARFNAASKARSKASAQAPQ